LILTYFHSCKNDEFFWIKGATASHTFDPLFFRI